MKVALVTGAMGHMGSIMVLKLIKEGWKVVATDLAGQARKGYEERGCLRRSFPLSIN